jgi:hypothetical protein
VLIARRSQSAADELDAAGRFDGGLIVDRTSERAAALLKDDRARDGRSAVAIPTRALLAMSADGRMRRSRCVARRAASAAEARPLELLAARSVSPACEEARLICAVNFLSAVVNAKNYPTHYRSRHETQTRHQRREATDCW